MTSQKIVAIPLENLRVDLINPRHTPQPSQREAIAAIAFEQGNKLVNLAEDIVDKGLNPSELPLVIPDDEAGIFIVVEGNRRITALKLLASPQLLASIGLQKSISEKFKELQKRAGSNLPKTINCALLSREDANHWIQLKHTGENDGIGIVSWDGRARQRFRGTSPALQAIELVENTNLITEQTRKQLEKISITNVERILGTPDARRMLGVDVKNNQLVFIAPDEEALGRLSIIITDIANKDIKVTDLDSKEQRVDYARKVASQPLPNAIDIDEKNKSGEAKPKPGTGRRISPDRKVLIPRSCKLTIPHSRLNKIYHELQKLSIDDHINACAVLFRVFIELSIDHYAKEKSISLKITPQPKPGTTVSLQSKDMSLREKIKTIYEYMENNNIADKAEMRGIKALYANRDHVLSVDGLNAYIHNKDFNPTPSDLKSNWDSIQKWVEYLWAI